MNKTFMNTVSLAKDPFIRKGEGGGGGGVTINNQEKSLEITENGVTEVTADSGFTGLSKVKVTTAIPTEEKTVEITENGTTEVVANDGFLSKVIVNTNVASSGGGGSDMPVIGDGKTYLYIKIAAEGRMKVTLYLLQSVKNGVTIDWGDGSEPKILESSGPSRVTHTYDTIGDYIISLDAVEGCTLNLGQGGSTYCLMGSTEEYVYCNMLKAIEIGKSVTSIGSYAFNNCYSLASVVIPNSVTSIGSYAFNNCYSLASIVIPNSVTSIDSNAFYYCSSLASIVIPNSVTSIGNSAFAHCYGMAFYDFSQSKTVPSITSGIFHNIKSDCKIIVPDALYDTWIAATNWSTYASKIIKKSDWDAQS